MAHPDSGERRRHPLKHHRTVHTDCLGFFSSWEKDSTLPTVEEIASVRRTMVTKMGIVSQGFKRGHGEVTMRLRRYALAWSPGSNALVQLKR